MELMQRVASILKERDISQASFARSIDVSPQTLSGWMTGRNQPNIQAVARMCESLSVSPSWLITGREDVATAQSLVDADSVLIPMLDVQASCGNGSYTSSAALVKLIEVNRQWISRYCGQVNERALNIIGITGDSMSPTLEDGDFAVIDRSATRIYTDAMFAFQMSDDLYVKRFQRIGRNLKVISDNRIYDPYILEPHDLDSSFKVLGRVVTTCIVRSV